MDDGNDDFTPLSMTGLSLARRKNDISSSQVSSTSRLSRSYVKSGKNSEFGYESTRVNNSCAGSTVERMVTTVDLNQDKDSHHHHPSALKVQFCPVCQAPFDIMNIYPHVHVLRCNVHFNELEECPMGETCFSDSLFHYRDYAHTILAQIRASKGHLSHECLQYTTPEKVNKMGNRNKQLSGLFTPLSHNKNVKRTSSNAVGQHPPAHKKILFSNEEKTHIITRDDSSNMLQKCDSDETCGESSAGNIKIADHVTEDHNWKTFTGDKKKDELKLIRPNGINEKSCKLSNERVSKDLKFGKENLKSTTESGKSKESNSSILTTCISNCKRNENNSEEQKYAECHNFECDHELKLDAVVEYTTNKLGTRCDESRNIKTCVLPCKVESDAGHLNEVRATMSVVLLKSKEGSVGGENKLKTPVKVDASCSEVGWETVGVAAMSDTELADMTLCLCKCSKTMQINCSLSEKDTVGNVSKKRGRKKRKLESKFFSNVRELKLPHNRCKKQAVEIPHHQMSVTSYFQSSHSQKIPTECSTKDVKSTSSSFAVPQHSDCFQSNDLNTARTEECLGNSSRAPKQSKESVVAHWKQILHGMRQKGLSTMSVMSDSSLSVTSDSQTSAATSHSFQQCSGKKTCPRYKRIPETSFVVDAFQYGIIPGISHYFLSHFHSDHYGGLRKSFSKPIYCSRITAALVKMKLRVDERYLHVLDLDVPQKVNGVLVTSLDANHCPGSVMFLFQLQDGRNFLHVGDFRADPKMESYPCFWNLTIDRLYLDTTYCDPRYSFPEQSETTARVVELAKEHRRREPDTLFICGTYTLGKEKVFLGIAEALDCKLWAHSDKRKVLECIDNPIINERLTDKQWEAHVHVCRMSDLNMSFLTRYLEQHQGIFTSIVAFIPTGWEMSRKSKSTCSVSRAQCGRITIYGIPYSEHSSFTELKRFVQFLKPAEIIPTVNVEHATKRNAMTKYFRQWLSESPVTSLEQMREGKQFVQQKMSQFLKPP